MANKRMFSRQIINSARFLKMPSSSRLLYYDLGMAADDEGIVEAYSVIQTTGASEDDLRVLVSKEFVKILNSDLVTFIMDWSQNNFIRKDRFQQSPYHELLVKCGISALPSPKNDVVNHWSTIGQPTVNPDIDIDIDLDIVKDNIYSPAKGISDLHSEKETATISDGDLSLEKAAISDVSMKEIPYGEIIAYLNEKAKTNYSLKSARTREKIKARYHEGFSIDDFKRVIDNKVSDWIGGEFEKYLRPETLFGSKFEGYLNQKQSARKISNQPTANSYTDKLPVYDDSNNPKVDIKDLQELEEFFRRGN